MTHPAARTACGVAALAALAMPVPSATAGVAFGQEGIYTGTLDFFEITLDTFVEARAGESEIEGFSDASGDFGTTLMDDALVLNSVDDGSVFGARAIGRSFGNFTDISDALFIGRVTGEAATNTLMSLPDDANRGDASASVSARLSMQFTLDVLDTHTSDTIPASFDMAGYNTFNNFGSSNVSGSLDGPGVSYFPFADAGESIDIHETVLLGDGTYFLDIEVQYSLSELQNAQDGQGAGQLYTALFLNSTDFVDRPDELEPNKDGEIVPPPPLIDPNDLPTPGGTALLAIAGLYTARRKR